jgi:hypothetical protein
MLSKELTEANKESLLEGNFSGYITRLYELGIFLENNFVQTVKSSSKETVAEADKRKRFYNYISERFFVPSNFPPEQVTQKKLITSLWNLKVFLVAWEDSGLRGTADKELRQTIKFKKDIDKSIRRAIHAALIAEALRVCKEAYVFYGKKLSVDFSTTDKIPNEICLDKLSDAIELLSSNNKPPEDIEQKFKKAAEAISSFKPTADKFLQGVGLFIGVIAALAVGTATGGFIFLLLSGFGASLVFSASIGFLMFIASSRANFPLFSIHSSKFLCSMARSGGITEFIDKEGKRAQLSTHKKYLLLFGAFVSVSVGLSTAALTIMFGTKLIAILFPMLAVMCPPLAGIIVGILVVGVAIGLSLVMLKGWVDFLQSQFSLRDSLTRITDEIKALSFAQLSIYMLKLVLKITFIGFALFGLFFLCFTGIPSLVPALGSVGSWIVGFASFIGDLPFTIITILAFCNSLSAFNFFSRTEQINSREVEKTETSSLSDKSSFFMRIFNGSMLVINAIGRSIQVFNGSIVSAIAAAACCISAFAGTLIKQDDKEKNARRKADGDCKQSLLKRDGEDDIQQGTTITTSEDNSGETVLNNNVSASQQPSPSPSTFFSVPAVYPEATQAMLQLNLNIRAC